MTDLGPETKLVDTKEILEKFKSQVQDKIKSVIDEDTEPEKIEQYRKARINDFYWRGIFEIAASRLNEEVVDFTSIGTPISQKSSQRRELGYNLNIIRGDFIKAVAVLGAKSPDVSAVPDEADDEEAIDVARRADIVAQTWATAVDVDALQMELMLDLSTTSTTFIWTGWRVDGDKYGWDEEPDLQETEQVPMGDPVYKCVGCGNETPVDYAIENGACSNPDCGQSHTPEDYTPAKTVPMPKDGGTKRYPKGGVECEIHNIFTFSTPFFSRTLRDSEWSRCEYETTPSAIWEIFPDLSKEIVEGTGETGSNAGTQFREQASSERGIQRNRANKVRYTRYWLRPSFFNNYREEKVDVEEGQEEQTLADLLKERFPRGVRVTMVNGIPVDLFEESMDDVWTTCKPTVSKFIFCDPLCQDTVPVQELLNRFNDISIQTLVRALPVTLFDTQLLDHKYLRENPPLTAEMLPVKPQGGRSISDSMGQMPMAKFSDQQMPFMQGVRIMSRENNGITDQIYGGGPGLNTAHEAEIRKQQALMQLRITYNNTRKARAEFTGKAVRQYAKYAPAQFKSKPKEGLLGPSAGESIQIADLIDGKFHFEADEGMPRTFEDERNSFREMVAGPTAVTPEMQAALGLTSPVNLPRTQKYFGAAGWYYPGKDERTKLRKILGRLLQEAPQQGQDGSDAPSVALDPFDDPAIMGTLMQAWLNSEAGQTQAESNQQGFKNAVAYWQACQTASKPPAQIPVKGAVSVAVKDLPPDQAVQVMNKLGLEVSPSAMPTPAEVKKSSQAQGQEGKPPTIPQTTPGGQGEEVPEPQNPVPQPGNPIPGA